MIPPKKSLIAFATRWGAQFGGINSFNTDLLGAFASAFYSSTQTVCIVLNATPEDIESAQHEQVLLISLDLPEQKDFIPALECNAWQALQTAAIDLNPNETAWLGHDRITGGIALAAAKSRGGKTALIHHMSYDHYEAFTENSRLAHNKELEQRRLFKQADIALAVGPLLRDALGDMLGEENIHMLIPGFADIPATKAPTRFKGFLSGRLSDDANKIKQAHLGVAAFSDAIRQTNNDDRLPDAFRSEKSPSLTLRGVNFDSSEDGDASQTEIDLKIFSEKYAECVFPFQTLPFTTDRKILFDDLSRSSVAMMPSWHEGFGLVAWEAIAAGVPLILSKNSGVYRLLAELKGGFYLAGITDINVAGSHNSPFFLPQDQQELTNALINIAKDPQKARSKAASLRETLSSEYSWSNCAKQLATALSWQKAADEEEPIISPASAIKNPHHTAPAVALISLLELPRPNWQHTNGLSDSGLLRAEEAVIPFDSNRNPYLDTQMEWVHSGEYPIAVRLLTGTGGVGKTRLALEMCRKLQQQNWQAGFLRGDSEPSQMKELVNQVIGAQQPCCIVIDYAETRQALLLALLKALLAKQIKQQIKILLLARDGGEWWNLLPTKDAACEAFLEGSASSGPFKLPQLHNTDADRQAAYSLALNTFACRLQISPPDQLPLLNEQHFAHPLYIQMAALMALRGERPKSAEALPRALVNHERRYWRKALSEIDGDPLDHEERAAKLITLATLFNGIATEGTVETIWLKLGEKKPTLKQLLRALTPLYSDRQGMQGLRPDLIGEALVAQVLLSPIGKNILDTALEHGTKNQRHSTLTVLARLLRYREDIALTLENSLAEHFPKCVNELVDACIQNASSLPQAVERAYARLKPQQKLQIAFTLKPHTEFEILPLMGLTILIWQVLTKQAETKLKKKNPAAHNEYAETLRRLAIALRRGGKTTKALTAAEKSVSIRKNLALSNPEIFDTDIAESLSSYAIILSELGRDEEALKASSQALDIHLKSNKAKPNYPKENIATLLNNHAAYLLKAGEIDNSLKNALQAHDIYLQVTESPSEQLECDLAMSLNNLANLYAIKSEYKKSLTALQQALTIYRKLASSKPERFNSDLAMALHNSSIHLGEHGRYTESLAAAKESLLIYSQLAKIKPERFDADMAGSQLKNCSCLAALGKIQDALEAAQQAEAIYLHLSIENPPLYVYDLEASKLKTAYLQWLISAEYTLEQLKLTLEKIENPSQKDDFTFEYLSFLTFTGMSTDAAAKNTLDALECWATLDRNQQHYNEDSFLLLAALAEHTLGTCSAPANWREQLETFRQQRQGCLPWTMTETARRAGFEL